MKKTYTKYAEEASPRPFYKKSKLNILNISEETVWNVIKFVFIVCPSRGHPKYFETKVLTTPFFIYMEFFLKIKRGLKLDFLPIFCMIFKEKCFSRYIRLTDQIPLPDCIYFFRYCAICTFNNFLYSLSDTNFEINFGINLGMKSISEHAFSCMTKKSRQQYKYIENKKCIQHEIKRTFHHF